MRTCYMTKLKCLKDIACLAQLCIVCMIVRHGNQKDWWGKDIGLRTVLSQKNITPELDNEGHKVG